MPLSFDQIILGEQYERPELEAYCGLMFDGYNAEFGDFLSLTPEVFGNFDRIVMNPPFSRDQDARHVCHAFNFLKPDGRLIAIVGSYALNDKTEHRRKLQDLMRQQGRLVRELPAGTFNNNARSVIIELPKHKA